MNDLANKQCKPCRGGVPPMNAEQTASMLERLDGWEAVDNHHLSKTYKFKNFAQALEFTNSIGAIAEEQQHHPDIHLAWGRVRVEIWTHKIDGLTESDFVLAAKFDRAV